MDWSWHPAQLRRIPEEPFNDPSSWFQSASLGTKIFLSMLLLFALFQTIFFLSLIVMNAWSLVRQKTTKHFQFKISLFAIGFFPVLVAKVWTILWGAVLYPGYVFKFAREWNESNWYLESHPKTRP
jgi:hypothetical protein